MQGNAPFPLRYPALAGGRFAGSAGRGTPFCPETETRGAEMLFIREKLWYTAREEKE